MKTLKTILLFSIAVFFFTGCKKDDAKPTTTQEKILGRWNFTSLVIVTTNPPNPVTTETITGRPDHYFDFRTDGIVKTNIEGDDESAYVVQSNTTFEMFDNIYTIKELTPNKFVFEWEESNSTRSSKGTFTLTR